MAKKKVSAKAVILGISMVILLAFAVIATVTVGVQQGWNIPGIGSIGVAIGTIIGQQGTGYSTTTSGYTTSAGSGPICTGSSCPSGSVLPPGQVAFNMALVGVFSDGGANSTISNQQGLPGLDAITIGGRPLKFVDAQSVVGYVSSAPLPAGSTAEFKVNETSFNEHSNFVNWHYYDYRTGFIQNNMVALFLLPDFPISGLQVFADSCTNNSTGGVSCNLPNGTIQSRRVDWNVQTMVTISTPNLAVLPVTYSNLAVAAADFDGRHMVGCTNCGGGPTGPGTPSAPAPLQTTFGSGGTANINANPPGPPVNPAPVSQTGTPPIQQQNPSPIIVQTIVGVSAPYAGSSVVANSQVTGLTKDNTGHTVSGGGSGSSGAGTHHTGYGNCLSELPNFCVAAPASLLPINYVALSVGSLELVNTLALVLFGVIWVFLAIGIAAFVMLYRRLGKPKRRKR